MARHIWSVLCRQTSLDETTQALSLFSVLEELEFVPDQPLVDIWMNLLYPAVLVSLIHRSDFSIPERCRIKVEVIGPNNEVFNDPLEGDVDLSENPRNRVLVNLQSIPFRGFGIHSFRVHLARPDSPWVQVADVPLEIKQKPAVPLPAAQMDPPRPRSTVRRKSSAKS